ncbi:MAG TPA: 2-keto-3-deoxygluconate permease [Thermaerobacter sp.]
MKRGNMNPWLAVVAILVGNAAGNVVATAWLGSRIDWLTRALGPSLAPVTLKVPYLGSLTFGFDLQVTAAGLLGIALVLIWLRRH